MKRFVFLAAPIASLALAGATAAAVSEPTLNLDTRAISARQCTPNGSGAQQVVDVNFRISNYDDSGYTGAWAIDNLNRRLRIWRHADGTYCAQVLDTSSTFVTEGGYSPLGTAFLAPGIKGTFEGGYITLDIVGKFVPKYPTHGDLGSFDAKCDPQFNCPGAHPSWLSYFENPRADEYAQWGWLYNAGQYGSWLDQVNVASPRGGDIRSGGFPLRPT